LRSVERRFVGEAVYGMIRWRRRLGFAIGSEHATPLAMYLVWLAGEFPGDAQVETELRVAGIDPASVRGVGARLAAIADGSERQDAGSQAIAELTAPPPRGVVVDACAGAGGKTLALGALLANRGRLIAFDVSDDKLEELRTRARRAGLTNVQALVVDDKIPSS